MAEPDDETRILLAVEAALSPADREALLEKAAAQNPWLRGAKVADVLDIYYQADAFLGRREAFWDNLQAGFTATPSRQVAISLALIAAELLGRDDAWVLRLAAKATP